MPINEPQTKSSTPKGIMTKEEIDKIIKGQVRRSTTGNPYIDDYYHRAHLFYRQKKSILFTPQKNQFKLPSYSPVSRTNKSSKKKQKNHYHTIDLPEKRRHSLLSVNHLSIRPEEIPDEDDDRSQQLAILSNLSNSSGSSSPVSSSPSDMTYSTPASMEFGRNYSASALENSPRISICTKQPERNAIIEKCFSLLYDIEDIDRLLINHKSCLKKIKDVSSSRKKSQLPKGYLFQNDVDYLLKRRKLRCDRLFRSLRVPITYMHKKMYIIDPSSESTPNEPLTSSRKPTTSLLTMTADFDTASLIVNTIEEDTVDPLEQSQVAWASAFLSTDTVKNNLKPYFPNDKLLLTFVTIPKGARLLSRILMVLDIHQAIHLLDIFARNLFFVSNALKRLFSNSFKIWSNKKALIRTGIVQAANSPTTEYVVGLFPPPKQNIPSLQLGSDDDSYSVLSTLQTIENLTLEDASSSIEVISLEENVEPLSSFGGSSGSLLSVQQSQQQQKSSLHEQKDMFTRFEIDDPDAGLSPLFSAFRVRISQLPLGSVLRLLFRILSWHSNSHILSLAQNRFGLVFLQSLIGRGILARARLHKSYPNHPGLLQMDGFWSSIRDKLATIFTEKNSVVDLLTNRHQKYPPLKTKSSHIWEFLTVLAATFNHKQKEQLFSVSASTLKSFYQSKSDFPKSLVLFLQTCKTSRKNVK